MPILRPLVLAFLLLSSAASAETILFIGNSFTFGALSPVMNWQAAAVTDLNQDGIGGVPALFKRFADESRLNFDVSLETSPGKTLQWHWLNRRSVLDRPWDNVVLQEYSTLDPDRPGNPANLLTASAQLATMFRKRNSKVRIGLVATWSRPDLTFPPAQHWSGQPIQRMALDIRRADEEATHAAPAINFVIPVGEAFNCAIAAGIADANPYDGISPGLIDLWAPDHYHASTAGYYLEALTVFARVTNRDPRRLGANETAARELGMPAALAMQLQRIAHQIVSKGRCSNESQAASWPSFRSPWADDDAKDKGAPTRGHSAARLERRRLAGSVIIMRARLLCDPSSGAALIMRSPSRGARSSYR
jgi:hypothetical protein